MVQRPRIDRLLPRERKQTMGQGGRAARRLDRSADETIVQEKPERGFRQALLQQVGREMTEDRVRQVCWTASETDDTAIARSELSK